VFTWLWFCVLLRFWKSMVGRLEMARWVRWRSSFRLRIPSLLNLKVKSSRFGENPATVTMHYKLASSWSFCEVFQIGLSYFSVTLYIFVYVLVLQFLVLGNLFLVSTDWISLRTHSSCFEWWLTSVKAHSSFWVFILKTVGGRHVSRWHVGTKTSLGFHLENHRAVFF